MAGDSSLASKCVDVGIRAVLARIDSGGDSVVLAWHETQYTLALAYQPRLVVVTVRITPTSLSLSIISWAWGYRRPDQGKLP